MAFTIYFATTTGKTEDIAERLKDLLDGSEIQDVDSIDSAADLSSAEALVCCIPTWNTGADTGRSGTAWDTFIEEIPSLDLSGKPVAILGLGDSSSYSDYFADAMEELYSAFKQSGAKMIGSVPIDGYTFNSSKSVVDGKFCGLPIDEDSEPDLSDERLQAWASQISQEV